jgi:hypothetical protein
MKLLLFGFIHRNLSSTNLLDHNYSLLFVKDSKTVIVMNNSHQLNTKKEKIIGFLKKFLLCGLSGLSSECGLEGQVYVNKS